MHCSHTYQLLPHLRLRFPLHFTRLPLDLSRHLLRFAFSLSSHLFGGPFTLFGFDTDGRFEGGGGLFC